MCKKQLRFGGRLGYNSFNFDLALLIDSTQKQCLFLVAKLVDEESTVSVNNTSIKYLHLLFGTGLNVLILILPFPTKSIHVNWILFNWQIRREKRHCCKHYQTVYHLILPRCNNIPSSVITT